MVIADHRSWACLYSMQRRYATAAGAVKCKADAPAARYELGHIPARWRTVVRDHAKEHETLSDLNRNYVRSVDEADTSWFDANLARWNTRWRSLHRRLVVPRRQMAVRFRPRCTP